MKIVVIIHNVAIGDEVMEFLEGEGISSYTCWEQVTGKGKISGPHLDSHIWPASNSILAIALKDNQKDKVVLGIKKMKKKFAKEGLKAFVLPLEEEI
ncbi:MAG: hypothetical protein KAJ48_10360 [Elusimicrobiales bacterium]|nr:hypothetical protein [Elusimicrobiales bacterium]